MKKLLCVIICTALIIGIFSSCARKPANNQTDNTSQNSEDNQTQIELYNLNAIDPEFITSNTVFAFNLFKKLNSEDANKNIFISPLSISTALTMTYNGAGSTTAEAMAKALGYTGMELSDINSNYKNLLVYLNNVDPKVTLNISNSIWFRKGEIIKEEFLQRNKEIFKAYIEQLDFSEPGAADVINNWIKESTQGKIDKMVDSPIPKDVVMYLINAIYFKGDWTVQFDKNQTFAGSFYTEDGKKHEVQMMKRKGEAEYGEIDGAKAIKLPYGSGKFSMYCILPPGRTSIKSYIEELNAEKWEKLKKSVGKKSDVIINLPRFKMEYGVKKLNDCLISLGMEEAFSSNADFSGIEDNIFISRVLHKAVIEVNEEGSEAAAATVVEMTKAALLEPVEFIADRPFIFIIADEVTGTLIFMGVYVTPPEM